MAPVFTPFNDDVNKTLNLKIIPQYAKFLESKNITGILVGGTTGEGLSLSIEERKQLVAAWASAVKETKQHLMVHIGGLTFAGVKELTIFSESLHVDSLLCLPDLFYKPTKIEELFDYFSSIGKLAPNTPLLYYQSSKVKINIKADEFFKFSEDKIPTLVGVKLDSSDIKDGLQALTVSKRFTVIYGSKMIILAGCAIEVNTFMSATMNFIPEYSIKLIKFCNEGSNFNEARKNQNILNKIEKEILQYGGYIETMKTAMSLMTNLYMGPPRLPLKSLSQENVDKMQKSLLTIKL
ncbi:PREDICTED: N-acetylneuraminate lyase-like [Ceratosolen solmsi marchali]|uniref:N-acetylneuraminate lyase n=1 Tax=Ceratosolen solmsi marchali TaxID=326594 RepID=A0AAJ6YWA5_9HYME|nr:PREDICTED: N-acetylneuraminate lyase-like [Ceratosolen solmsi marchali]